MSDLSLSAYDVTQTHRVLPLLRHPDRLFVQVDWQTTQQWLSRADLCGVIGWQAERPVGLLLSGPPHEGTAWLRMAALSNEGLLAGGGGYTSRLSQMWEALVTRLRESGARRVVVLPIEAWIRRGLEPLGFQEVDRILEMRFARPEVTSSQSPADVRLRPATANDLDALLAIDTAAFSALWRMERVDLEAALDAGARIALAETAGQIAGFQITYAHDNRAHLARLAVLPEKQRQGLGGVLLAADLVAYRDADAITLNVLDSSRGAQRLYTRQGFVFSGNQTPLWALDLI